MTASVSRIRAVAALRLLFALLWLVDASLKWSPSFVSGFTSYVSGAETGQPPVVKTWLGWWVSLLGHDPHLFARLVAVGESAVAIGLFFGVLTNAVCAAGGVLSLLIWATAEGFGGPYMSGTTDVGTSIAYVVIFALLAVGGAGGWAGVDRWLQPRLGRFGWLCSPPADAIPGPSRWRVILSGLAGSGAVAVGLWVALATSASGGMGTMDMPAADSAVTAPGGQGTHTAAADPGGLDTDTSASTTNSPTTGAGAAGSGAVTSGPSSSGATGSGVMSGMGSGSMSGMGSGDMGSGDMGSGDMGSGASIGQAQKSGAGQDQMDGEGQG